MSRVLSPHNPCDCFVLGELVIASLSGCVASAMRSKCSQDSHAALRQVARIDQEVGEYIELIDSYDGVVLGGGAMSLHASDLNIEQACQSIGAERAEEQDGQARAPSHWFTDEELPQFYAGDAALWTKLYRHYTPALLARTRAWYRASNDSMDVVQETWIRAYEQRAQCQRSATVGAWLHRICRNFLVDLLRASKRRVAGEAALRRASQVVDLESTTEEPVEYPSASDIAWIREQIDLLPARQREVVTLRWILGLSTSDTAARLGLAQGTVKATLHQGRETLRRRRASKR